MTACLLDEKRIVENEADCELYSQLLEIPMTKKKVPDFPNGCFFYKENPQKNVVVFNETTNPGNPKNTNHVYYGDLYPLLDDAFNRQNLPLSEICKESQMPSWANGMLKTPPFKYMEDGTEKLWNGKKFCEVFSNRPSDGPSDECCEFHVNKAWSECYRKNIFSYDSTHDLDKKVPHEGSTQEGGPESNNEVLACYIPNQETNSQSAPMVIDILFSS